MSSSKSLSKDRFEEQLVGLQEYMYSFAYTLTADREAAEDLRQETTLKVLDKWTSYKENTNFKGWVFTVMRNLFINNYHRLVRTYNIFDANTDITYNGIQKNTAGLSAPDHQMSLDDINGAIEGLTNELKMPFSMYVSGYKYREIAEVLDLPLGTVKSRIFMARKQLQEALAEYKR